MKYIVFSLLLLNLTACSFWGSPEQKNTTTDIMAGSGQTAQSGVTTADASGAVSPENTNNAMTNASGSTSNSHTGTVTSSGHVSTGTGTTMKGSGAADNDAEVQSITNDIDKIFDDIAKDGK